MRRPTPGWGVRDTPRGRRAAAGVAACTTALALACTPDTGRRTTTSGPATPARSAAPSVATCPLTGLPTATHQPASRPGVAVVVADSPPSRPQAGLDKADVVFQEPVEGGGAWFLAIFQCSDAAEVGPVRDPHLVDASILAQYRPVLLGSSGDRPLPPAMGSEGSGIESLDARSAASSAAYHRDRTRRPPHNLFTSTQKLRSLSSASGSPAPLEFAPAPAPGSGATEAPAAAVASPATPTAGKTLSLAYSDETTRYVYDPAAGDYRRFVGSEPHVVKDGPQIRVTNVVVLWLEVSEVEARDRTASRAPDARLEGEGDALLLQGGVERGGRWRRGPGEARIELFDRKGAPLRLRPGNTWVHLLPDTRPAYVG